MMNCLKLFRIYTFIIKKQKYENYLVFDYKIVISYILTNLHIICIFV